MNFSKISVRGGGGGCCRCSVNERSDLFRGFCLKTSDMCTRYCLRSFLFSSVAHANAILDNGDLQSNACETICLS